MTPDALRTVSLLAGGGGWPAALLVAAIAVPLALAVAMLVPAIRRHAPELAVAAPIPALLTAAVMPRGQAVLLSPYPFRFTLALDAPGALLLGGAALLWIAAGAYAARYLRKDPARIGFACWWLLTMAGSFAVFLVADVASFYLAYALVSFSAYGLAAHDDTPEARRAGSIYLSLTILGEALLIAAFVMLASGAQDANPLIRDAVATLPGSPRQGLILALLLLGFTLKMGLFPLHVWMPLAHAVAPVPGSAALSGVVVKAGVIGLIRFLPESLALPGWGDTLLGAGLFTAVFGVVVGLTQRHPKRALAYSTVSQMGVVAAVLGAGLAAGNADAGRIAAFYAVNHMLLKGAMFLAVGVAMACGTVGARRVALVAAVLGLSLAGLPFTGGSLAKYATKLVVRDDAAAFLLALSAAGTTLLMARYALLVSRSADSKGVESGIVVPFTLLAVAALAAPFAVFEPVTGLPVSSAFGLDALAKGLWPVVLGSAFAALLYLYAPTVREIPAGDVLVLVARLRPLAARCVASIVAVDRQIERWPVASLALAGIVVALTVLLRLRG